MGWRLRGLGVAKLGLNGVGVGGVRGRKTRASFLPKALLTTRNSQFGWLGLGVAPKFVQKVRARREILTMKLGLLPSLENLPGDPRRPNP